MEVAHGYTLFTSPGAVSETGAVAQSQCHGESCPVLIDTMVASEILLLEDMFSQWVWRVLDLAVLVCGVSPHYGLFVVSYGFFDVALAISHPFVLPLPVSYIEAC